MIRFLFKIGLLLCLIFLALSYFMPMKNSENSAAEKIGLFSAVTAFGAVLHDMDGFCARNPQSCETGKNIFAVIAEKTRQGADFAAQWLAENFSKGAANTEQRSAKQAQQSAKTAEKLPAPKTEEREKTKAKLKKAKAAQSKNQAKNAGEKAAQSADKRR